MADGFRHGFSEDLHRYHGLYDKTIRQDAAPQRRNIQTSTGKRWLPSVENTWPGKQNLQDLSCQAPSLVAARLAGIPPNVLTPAMERAIAQWLDVLPLQTVVQALRHVSFSEEPLSDFREVALIYLRRERNLSARAAGAPKRLTDPTIRKNHVLAELSEADRKALMAQNRLESMSDGEYQEELVRRIAEKARQPRYDEPGSQL
jgi:hypothetical protein